VVPEFRDEFFLVRRDDVERIEVRIDVDSKRRPGLFLSAGGISAALDGRSRMCPILALTM
jgi:hypothetical protein